MGAGASTSSPGVGTQTGALQGVEKPFLTRFVETGMYTNGRKAQGFEAASMQVELLRGCECDQDAAADCIKSITIGGNEFGDASQCNRFWEEICGCGFDTLLLALLRNGTWHAALQREGFVAIGTLAFQSEARKTRLIALGAGAQICHALEVHPGDVKLHQEGLWALGNLSAAGWQNKRKLFYPSHGKGGGGGGGGGRGAADEPAAFDFPTTVIRAITRHKSEALVAKCGLVALGNFANGSHPRALELLAREGQGQTTRQSDEGGEARDSRTACNSSSGGSSSGSSSSFSGAVTTALREHASNSDVVCYGCYAAASACEFSPDYCAVFAGATPSGGLLTCLGGAVRAHAGNALTMGYALKLLAIFIAHGPLDAFDHRDDGETRAAAAAEGESPTPEGHAGGAALATTTLRRSPTPAVLNAIPNAAAVVASAASAHSATTPAVRKWAKSCQLKIDEIERRRNNESRQR